jgi:hypothetical protein
MNAEEIKKIINYDMQLGTFSIAMHAEAAPVNEEWGKLALELVEFANKFGRFVQKQREIGFTPVQVQG